MGITQVEMLQIQPENHFAIEIHVKFHGTSPETKYHYQTV